jgi:capsular polysaccharide transport system permease protein
VWWPKERSIRLRCDERRQTLTALPDSLPARPHWPGAAPRRRLFGTRAIGALMLREMSTRYGRTPGGYIWALLEPVGAILVIAVALSFIIRVPPLGNSFLLFYAAGYLPFLVYNLLQAHVGQALAFSRPLLMYPAVSWIDAILARFLLNLLTSFAITATVLCGVLWIDGTGLELDPGPMFLSVLLLALLGLGHGTLNCLLFGLFPAWAQVWSILSRPLMVVAGVFFLMEDLPRNVQDILWWTPWIHATSLFRQAIYTGYQPDFISVPLILLWALLPLALGLALLRRFRQEILMT